jgi:DNA-binding NarL/FixJ family response regulator
LSAEVGVLIVEDDAMVRGWVRLSLRSSEFRVVGEAGDAGLAVELCKRRVPDLLLVDYRFPTWSAPSSSASCAVRESARRQYS